MKLLTRQEGLLMDDIYKEMLDILKSEFGNDVISIEVI